MLRELLQLLRDRSQATKSVRTAGNTHEVLDGYRTRTASQGCRELSQKGNHLWPNSLKYSKETMLQTSYVDFTEPDALTSVQA